MSFVLTLFAFLLARSFVHGVSLWVWVIASQRYVVVVSYTLATRLLLNIRVVEEQNSHH